MLPACYDCIFYKEPKMIQNVRKFNDNGYCLKHNDYAERVREDDQKCGLYGRDFYSRFPKNSKENEKK
jgi:hypothetical protein